MVNKLEFKRDHKEARQFELKALAEIWIKGGLDGQYTPDPISEFRLEAGYVDETNRNLSVFFFVWYNDIQNIEIALANDAGAYDYGGQIPLRVDDTAVSLEFLDPVIEDRVTNSFRDISTMGEGERNLWVYDSGSGTYVRA